MEVKRIRRSWGTRLLLVLAALKLLAGVTAFVLGQTAFSLDPNRFPIPAAIYAGHLLVWGSGALFLMVAGRADDRAWTLGANFLLVGSAFADRLILGLAPSLPPALAPAAGLWAHLHPMIFIPVFGWMLASTFPVSVSFGPRAAMARAGLTSSLVAGTALFVANLVAPLVFPAPIVGGILEPLTLIVVLTLQLAANAFMVWQMPLSAIETRRRVGLFVAALVVGGAPIALEIVLVSLVPAFRRWGQDPDLRPLMALVPNLFVFSVPFTTTYSVLVDRVFDVRLVIRRAMQYALARSTLLALFSIPAVWSMGYVYQNRGLTVGQLLGAHPAGIGATVAAALLAFRIRKRTLATLNRRFFREQYDAQRILAALVDMSRRATDATELAILLSGEIDRALHLDGVVVLVADATTRALRSPLGTTRPIDLSSALLTLVAGDSAPLDVDVESSFSPVARLPESERQWLADAGCRLLVPLIASDGSLVGMLALAEKKSELPFSREDRALLSAIAASGALTLENRLHRSSVLASQATPSGALVLERAASSDSDQPAGECRRCSAVYAPEIATCPDCHLALQPAAIPLELVGKFRLERRIGAGAMGVVYRATDFTLDRPVAIKTMPRVSPESVMRLRREARAMAAITHANLAIIFAAESWRGTPVLILEFLDGGTLADRLRGGRLPVRDVLMLGVAMADVLDKTHAAGVLHRDIKPSNIGYTASGTPKLLDFGLARLASRLETNVTPADLAVLVSQANQSDLTQSQVLVGTIPYLSPEAVKLKPPDPGMDLWSLTLVLFEAISGTNPVAKGDAFHTIASIAAGRIPSLDQLRPELPPEIVTFFRDALALDAGRRPSTARQLAQRLELLQQALADTELQYTAPTGQK